MISRKIKVLGAGALLSLGLNVSAQAATCEYIVNNNWGSGFTGLIRITNTSSTPIDGWSVNWSYQNNRITSSWNATLAGTYTATPAGWNRVIGPNQSVEFGFQGDTNGGVAETPRVTGAVCDGSPAPSSSSSSSAPASSSAPTSSSASVSSTGNSASLVLQERNAGVCKGDDFENINTGFTGEGYINTPNQTGANILWSVNAAQSRQYTLQIRYANNGAARPAELRINNGANGAHSVNFPSTGDWTNWQQASVMVDLVQGTNTLDLRAMGAEGLANIDSLTVVGSGAMAGSCPSMPSSSSSSSNASSSTPSTGGNLSAQYPCNGSTAGYNAVLTKSGSNWNLTRNGSTSNLGSDTREAIQRALDSLSSGRTRMESLLVQGSGTLSANSRISLPSYTLLNVCGTLEATGSGSGDNAPIYARGRQHISIPNVGIAGTPPYAMFFRDVNDLHLGAVDIRVRSGAGIRIDNHGSSNRANKAQRLRIDNVYVEGTSGHGVETYGINNVTVGTVTARNTGYAGLIFNDTTNATVDLVDAQGAGTGTGYAAFRMANRNGRIGSSYATNIRVKKVVARGGGRGIFCVSESGGAVIDEIDLANTGNNSVLIENCYNVTIGSGRISGGGEFRIAARSEFPNTSDITVRNLSVSGIAIRESPCAGGNTSFSNISLSNGATMNVCR